MATDGGGAGRPQTFLFADLAGFTAFTEAHGDEDAAELVERFCVCVRDLLPEYEAHEVKAIGDALLIRSPRADLAVRLALRLAGEVGGQHEFPAVRVGIHTGPAVERGSDWFGATVNIAARVSEDAGASEVLVTRATREAAADGLADLEFRPRPSRRYRNVSREVETFAVAGPTPMPAHAMVVDPVCRMALDPRRAVRRTSHAGRDHCFCSEACAEAFAEAPARYVEAAATSPDLRVSDAARERAVETLHRAYRRGRLSLEELDERASHALAARTRRELTAVTRDLPDHRRWRAARRRRRFWATVFPPYAWWLRWRRRRWRR